MRAPTHAFAFEVLCLQAADQGRGDVLFGDSLARARKAAAPFMVGEKFPSTYLEFPLTGDPFLDVTILYGRLTPEDRVTDPSVAGTERMLEWYSGLWDANNDVSEAHDARGSAAPTPDAAGGAPAAATGFAPAGTTSDAAPGSVPAPGSAAPSTPAAPAPDLNSTGRAPINCGFELDTHCEVLPAAAVHFQPRTRTDLVEPFFASLGEPDRAQLYLDQAKRMPSGWPLSFFGLFRGRPNTPLRVCGYLDTSEEEACANDPRHIADAFDQIGFRAYDDVMLARISRLMQTSPRGFDFQFDVYPDGSLGNTFSLDVNFAIEQPEAVLESFSTGAGARVMDLLEEWGAADDRWKLAAQAAFARAVPVENDDGSLAKYSFTLMPQWLKVRWTDGVQQPSKFYYLGSAGIV